jgi:hypothetical protein
MQRIILRARRLAAAAVAAVAQGGSGAMQFAVRRATIPLPVVYGMS